MLSKDYSKQNFTIDKPTWETVKIGALQRIADATEAMARNHLRLQEELDWKTKQYRSVLERAEKAERVVRALRGVITKMRKREVGK